MRKRERTRNRIIFLICFIIVAVIRWIATCGVVKLLTIFLSWEFRWGIATIIWLVAECVFTIVSITRKRHNSRK